MCCRDGVRGRDDFGASLGLAVLGAILITRNGTNVAAALISSSPRARFRASGVEHDEETMPPAAETALR